MVCAMRKVIFSILLVVVMLAVAVMADAQQAGKMFRIGFLDGSTAAGSAVLAKAFLQELSSVEWKGGTPATVVIGKIAFEFAIHFPILLGGDVLGVMKLFSFTI